MLIVAPSAATATTTTQDVVPFDLANVERYVEVAQFGSDAGGSDSKRTGYDVALDGSSVIFTAERGSTKAGTGSVQIRSWVGPERGDFSETTLPAPAEAKGFGYSVDLDEAAGIAVVGARYSNEVYVYARAGDAWSAAPTRVTPGTDARLTAVASFGESVSLSESHLVVGAPNSRVDGKSDAGAAFAVPVADLGSDAVAAALLLPEAQVHVSDVYGQVVTARGPTAVVAAPQHQAVAGDSNSYQVGQISAWNLNDRTPSFTVTPDVNQANVAFPASLEGGSWAGLGRAIAITETGAIIAGSPSELNYTGSAPGDVATDDTTTQGAVYVYNADGTLAGKTVSDLPHQYYFGASLDLNDTTDELFVGSLNLDGTADQGKVQVFDVVAPATATAAKPLATLAGNESQFGTFGILGGSVQAATTVDDDGTAHHRAIVSASGNVYVFESLSALTLTKTTSLEPGNASPSANEGRNIADYTVTVKNTTGSALSALTVTDDLTNVLDDADVSRVNASTGTATLAGSEITWTGDLAANETLTITYRATVAEAVVADDENVQNFTEPVAALVNTVSTTREADGVVTAVPSVRSESDAGDRAKWTNGVTVTTPIDGALKLEKTATDADGNGHAAPGEKVSYLVTATNVGGLPIEGATVSDNLANVLKYANGPENIKVSLVDRDGADLAAAAATFAEPMLSWEGDVPAGAVLKLSYEVTTKTAEELYPLEGGESLVNGVESPWNVDPEGPTTTVPVEDELTLAKTASPDSGSVVKPGDEITYTLTLANKDAEVAKTGVTVTDDLSAVLPYAELIGDPTAGATVDGTTLSWVGDVAAGETLTISYTVRVLDSAPDGTKIGNHAGSAQVREDPPGTEHEVDNPRGSVELAKHADPASGTPVRPGSTITYSITATNDTAQSIPDVVITDEISGPVTVVESSLPVGATLNGNVITWTGDVPANDSVTISYEVTVNADAVAPAVVKNVVTSDDMTNDPEEPPTTVHPVRTIELAKSSDPVTGSAVKPGDTITYTVTATNPSAVDFADVTLTDDLSGVLDNATLIEPLVEGAYDPLTMQFSWTGDISAGDSKSVSYQVRVNDVLDPEDAVLRNVVSSPDSPTSPETEHPTDTPRGQVTLAKTSDPASGSTVRPGDTVTYSVTVTNDTQRVIRDVRVVDDVSGVLANAKIDTDSLPEGMALNGTELVWIGDVPGNKTVTLAYSATIAANATAPAVIKNVVTSTDMTNDPEEPPTTVHPIGTVALSKTAVPTTGAPVKPGDTVAYTVTIHNPANAPINGVVVTDDLADVLDKATLVSGPDNGATIDKGVLTWTGNLAAHETVTVNYVVQVNADAFTGTLRNAVTSPDSPDTPDTKNPIGSLSLAKSTSVADGVAANRGEDVTYTVTIANGSGVDVAGASITDDLSDVLDNATLVQGSLQTVGGGSATISGSILTWNGDVQAGASVTITYTVTVNADAGAGESLRNAVVSPEAPDEPSTETPVGVVELAKASAVSPAEPAKPGSEVTYTVTIKNPSDVAVNGVEVHDNLNDVLQHAVVTTEPTATAGTVTRDAGQLTWTGDVPAGEEITITYVVKINDSVTPPAALRNIVTSPDSPDEPSTEDPIGSLELAKTTDVPAGSVVRMGDNVTYTVTVTNGSGVAIEGVTVADDLSDVLDNATLVGDPEIVAGGGALELKQNTLTWSGDVEADGVVEIRYTVKVNDDISGEESLRNVVTSPDSPTVPETENPIGTVSLSKASQPAAGSGVKPGETVTYTVTVRNTSGVDMSDVTATDDLSSVLPFATLVGEPEVISGGGNAVIDADAQTLTWTGDIAASQDAVIRYTVKVNTTAESGDVLRNVVVSKDSPEVPETEHPVTTIALKKTADPASGSTVRPGDTVTYTVTASNPNDVDATNVSVSDDLSDILDDAALDEATISVSDGSVATLTGSAITWTGTVPARDSITITYSVKVSDDATAPATLRNLVTSPHSPDTPDTENPVGTLMLAKVNDKGDGKVVKPGERVKYTVTITNPSAAALDDVTVSDSLADVLNNATWNDDAEASSGSVELDGETMRWTGSVPGNGVVTVTYSVTVKESAKAPAAIRNAVTSPDSPTTPEIKNPVGTVGLEKSSVPESGTVVKPGETVTYSVKVTNPSDVDQSNVEVTDNLSEVLGAAEIIGSPKVSDGSTVQIDAQTLKWVGTVPADGSVTITYEVRVKDDATAPAVLRNLVTSPDSEDQPETENPVGTVVLDKVADPGSGTGVKPGETVTYTVTVANPVDAPVNAVRVTDDLSGVLGSATITGDPTADSGDVSFDAANQAIVWAGDLAAKQVVRITYSVTVNDSAKQGDVLRNRVVSPDSPTEPETENPVGELVTSKRLLDDDGNPITSGTTVAPGQTLTYELTATNGLTEAQRVELRDDLGDVLDDAALVTPPVASWTAVEEVPVVTMDGSVVTWDHELPAGATVTITYTVKTDPKADGTQVLSNTLEVDGEEGPGTENPVGKLALTKSVNPAAGTAVKPGELVTYTVTALNGSDVAIAGAVITDDLTDVLDNAALVGDVEVSDGSTATIGADNILRWEGDFAAHSSVTLTYSVRVAADAFAPAVLRNLVTSPNSPDVPETENPVGTVTLLKQSVPAAGTAVRPGETVEYSVTVRNSTEAPISGVSVTDDLSDVVDNADLVKDSVSVSDGSTATIADGRLSWNGTVPANTDIVITYSVIVKKDATAPQVLRNLVTSPDSPDEPEVENPVGTLRLSKTSLPGSGSSVKPGDTVTYTVEIANDAKAAVAGTTVTDDLSDVLDDATLIGSPTATVGDVRIDGSDLVWTGDVPAGESIVLTYSVRVNDNATAPAVLGNVVSSPDSPNIPETENPVATVQLNKSSNPSSGIAVKPGDTVDYTITVTNPGAVQIDGVYVEDNLSDILDDASLIGQPKVSDGSKARLNGQSLSWTGSVPAGETVTITYSVLVSETAVAPATLRNLVTSPHSPDVPETVNPVGTVKLEKISDPGSGTKVSRGDKVTYTVKITNETPHEITGVVVNDDLSDVLDDATLVGDPIAPAGTTVAITGKQLTWTGTVPALSSTEIRYTVQVNENAVAPATLRNLVMSPHSPDGPSTENPVTPPKPGEQIPMTGGDIMPFVIFGLLALAAGSALVVRRTRKEEAKHA